MKPQKPLIGRPPRWPLAHEAAYLRTLTQLVWALDQAARATLARHGPALLRAVRARTDAEEPEEEDWALLLAAIMFDLSIAFAGAMSRLAIERAITPHAAAVDAFHKRDIDAIMRKAYGIALSRGPERWRLSVLRAWTDQNVALARSFPEQYAARLRAELTRAVLERRTVRDLNIVVGETTIVARRRAAFVARNEVGNLVAQLTAERHRDLGVKSFRWRTMRDEKVRASHEAREGREFFYGRPGPRPGAEPNCRCSAIAILPGLTTEAITTTA